MTNLSAAQIRAPSELSLIREALTWLEFPRLAFQSSELISQPRGNGGQVMVLPGFGAGDLSTLVLRQYLNFLGHKADGWHQGLNTADVPQLITTLSRKVDMAARNHGKPMALVGWSLGGYLAREIAREVPHGVSQVITLGSPVVGGPKFTAIARLYEQSGVSLDDIEAALAERERIPLTVPVTALYSRLDGIVAWEACIDERSGMTTHIEVSTTHCGLGFSAEVFRLLAKQLSRHH